KASRTSSAHPAEEKSSEPARRGNAGEVRRQSGAVIGILRSPRRASRVSLAMNDLGHQTICYCTEWISHVSALGSRHFRLSCRPPAESADIRRIERKLGAALPPSFRQVLVEFSGDFEFYWFLDPHPKIPKRYRNIWTGG